MTNIASAEHPAERRTLPRAWLLTYRRRKVVVEVAGKSIEPRPLVRDRLEHDRTASPSNEDLAL